MNRRIVFYGTLLSPFGVQQRLQIRSRLRLLRPCRIPGRLYDIGRYPGLVPGPGAVRGELYEALDDEVIAFLDDYEGPEYERRRIALLEPREEAWVYIYTATIEGRPWIRGGCWETHQRQLKVAATPAS